MCAAVPQHLVALHRGLQCADRIDLGDDDARALALQRLRAALAHVAVTADDGHLAGQHHVARAEDAVRQRVPAAVQVVELRLRHRVVDVDRREEERAGLHHLIEAVHAGGRLLGDTLQPLRDAGPALRALLELGAEQVEDDAVLLALRGRVVLRHAARGLELDALVDEQRRVAAVIEEQRRTRAVGPEQRLLRAPPVLLERLALPRVDGRTGRLVHRAVRADDHRGRRMILRGEDVAAHPAHVRAEMHERLDQHGRLHGHVQ
jgi:hypothetical protein